jgi:hypothetical protein
MQGIGGAPTTPPPWAGKAMITITLTFNSPAELMGASEALAKAAAGRPLTDHETNRLQIVAMMIRANIPAQQEA